MGYNSVILICNDDIAEIDKDPVGWWNRVKKSIFENCIDRGYLHKLISCEHADYLNVIIAGGNTATVIGSINSRIKNYDINPNTRQGQVEVLEEIVDSLGYKMVKK